jgi:hypothetical protein
MMTWICESSKTKVDMPNFNTTIIWILIFEWYVVMCGFKNGHQKYMCLKEIGLCAQHMLNHSSLDDQHDSGGTYEIFTLLMIQ